MNNGQQILLHRTNASARLIILRSLVSLLILLTSFVLADTSFAQTAPEPFVSTNRKDYSPGDTVIITGGNFQPGEVVTIRVQSPVRADRLVTSVADTSGSFTNTDFSPDENDREVFIKIAATGDMSGPNLTAFAHFYDATPIGACPFTVDSSILASNPGTSLFKTIQEAVTALPNPGPCTINIKATAFVGFSVAATVTFATVGDTITRSSGDFLTDGFAIGQMITTTNGSNPGPFTITNVTSTVITVGQNLTNTGSVTPTITVAPGTTYLENVIIDAANSGVEMTGNISFTAPSTITRTSGPAFDAAGFTQGQKITTSSATNPGPYTILSVTATVITVSETTVVTQAGAPSRTVATVAATSANKIIIQPDASNTVPVTVTAPGEADEINTSHAFSFQSSKFVTVIGLTFSGSARSAIRFRGDISPRNVDITISGNNINNNNPTNAAFSAIGIGALQVRIWVVNNLIRNNGRFGIDVLANNGPIHIVNNTIFGNVSGGVIRRASAVVNLVNNLLVGNGTAIPGTAASCSCGLTQESIGTAASLTLKNNMFYKNGNVTGGFTDIDNTATTLDVTDSDNRTTCTGAGTGCTTMTLGGVVGCTFGDCAATHAFTEIFASASDFHLNTTSPAIDAGLNSFIDPSVGGLEWVPGIDFEGTARPQGLFVDIGWDEVQADLCANVTCTALDQCHDVGVCNPATGICSNPAKADGTTCTDGNACTTGDTCQAGSCQSGTPVVCTASDQCHNAGVCDTGTGVCSNPAKADGTTCTDGNACTTGDTCQAGSCQSGTPVVCTASDQCHVAGVCNTYTGVCSNPAKADGTTCTDGNACTTGDTCQAGSCQSGTPVVCTASDQCHVAGVCNTYTGVCSNPAKADGTTCTDGNACTTGDSCQAGSCQSGTPVVCTASDQCHVAGVCNTYTGVCSNPAKPNGTACNDGNACTTGDTCQTGSCQSGTPVVCTASNDCVAEATCNTTSGQCEYEFTSCSQVTNSGLCPISEDGFRLIYLQDPALKPDNTYNLNNYLLNASNPGQFYYNVFHADYASAAGSTVIRYIDIPWPFVTQGANPIQAHDSTPPVAEDACWQPWNNTVACTFTKPDGNPWPTLSQSGNPVILLSNYTTLNKNIGGKVTVKAECPLPASGELWISIHLDYGLKKTTGWADELVGDNTADDATHSVGFGNGSVKLTDPPAQQYSFDNDDTGPDVVSSVNEFKKNAGVAGQTLQLNTGNPVKGLSVQLLDSGNKVVASAITDEDGTYQINYKHTGKAANFTVSLPQLKIKKTVQLKANGYALVIFDNVP